MAEVLEHIKGVCDKNTELVLAARSEAHTARKAAAAAEERVDFLAGQLSRLGIVRTDAKLEGTDADAAVSPGGAAASAAGRARRFKVATVPLMYVSSADKSAGFRFQLGSGEFKNKFDMASARWTATDAGVGAQVTMAYVRAQDPAVDLSDEPRIKSIRAHLKTSAIPAAIEAWDKNPATGEFLFRPAVLRPGLVYLAARGVLTTILRLPFAPCRLSHVCAPTERRKVLSAATGR